MEHRSGDNRTSRRDFLKELAAVPAVALPFAAAKNELVATASEASASFARHVSVALPPGKKIRRHSDRRALFR